MQLKKRTLKLGRLLFVTFLVSCASCRRFEWNPRPFVGDSQNEFIINAEGKTISCSEPEFDTFTCFDPANIAELKFAIDRVRSNKDRKRLKKAFSKAKAKHDQAKNLLNDFQ